MKITVYNREKLESSLEWDNSKKIATFTFFNSFGEEVYKKVVEGCATLEEAKQAIKPV